MLVKQTRLQAVAYYTYRGIVKQEQLASRVLEEAIAKQEASQEMLLKRLGRIEGWVRGIEKMTIDGRA